MQMSELEALRSASLRAYKVINAPVDDRLEAIGRLAARSFDAPMIWLSLLDGRLPWFLSARGPTPHRDEFDYQSSFCTHAIMNLGRPLVVPDARQDPRFASSPLVTGSLEVRAYVGMPLQGREGVALGTLCMLDTKPRGSSDWDMDNLRDLALAATAVMELRRHEEEQEQSEAHYSRFAELSPDIAWSAAADGTLLTIGSRIANLTGRPSEQLVGSDWMEIVAPADQDNIRRRWGEATDAGQPIVMEFRINQTDGSTRWLRLHAAGWHGGGTVRWYGTFQDIDDRRVMEEQAAYRATHDELTGLVNRSSFRDALQEKVRLRTQFALLCIDLDQFKAVNDTHGHPAGDLMLQQVAERIGACVRAGDVVARIGGDEFFVIQSHLNQPSDAAALAQRIIETMHLPMKIDGHALSIGVSIGIAISPRGGCSPDTLLRNSDLALYRAKADGRGGFRLFEPTMDAALRARQSLRLDLRDALERNELELEYQPIVNMRSLRIESFEALLRWNHPQAGRVPASEFISIAEESGLIVQLGQWVLQQACHEAVNWPAHVRVAVNLSPIQFKNDDLVTTVAASLQMSGLNPARLELEITETLPLIDDSTNLVMLQSLRRLGVCTVLDDFGTGYGSIAYLQSFRFDKLKIDQRFVAQIMTQDGAMIVRAIVALGRSLNIEVTAEGVETTEQLMQLRAASCHQMQGFLFSRAVPAEQIPSLLKCAISSSGLALPGHFQIMR